MQVEDSGKKKRGDTKDHSLGQWFTSFSEADELLQLAAARQQVVITRDGIKICICVFWVYVLMILNSVFLL